MALYICRRVAVVLKPLSEWRCRVLPPVDVLKERFRGGVRLDSMRTAVTAVINSAATNCLAHRRNTKPGIICVRELSAKESGSGGHPTTNPCPCTRKTTIALPLEDAELENDAR